MKNDVINFKDYQNILNVCKRLLKDKGEKKVSVVIFGEEMDDFLLALSNTYPMGSNVSLLYGSFCDFYIAIFKIGDNGEIKVSILEEMDADGDKFEPVSGLVYVPEAAYSCYIQDIKGCVFASEDDVIPYSLCADNENYELRDDKMDSEFSPKITFGGISSDAVFNSILEEIGFYKKKHTPPVDREKDFVLENKYIETYRSVDLTRDGDTTEATFNSTKNTVSGEEINLYISVDGTDYKTVKAFYDLLAKDR